MILKAIMALPPVRSAWRLTTYMTAATRSARGEWGGLAMSSSSLIKSESRLEQAVDEGGDLPRRQADTRFDDRPDDRRAVDSG